MKNERLAPEYFDFVMMLNKELFSTQQWQDESPISDGLEYAGAVRNARLWQHGCDTCFWVRASVINRYTTVGNEASCFRESTSLSFT